MAVEAGAGSGDEEDDGGPAHARHEDAFRRPAHDLWRGHAPPRGLILRPAAGAAAMTAAGCPSHSPKIPPCGAWRDEAGARQPPRCSHQVARLRKARKPVQSVTMVVKIDEEIAGSAPDRCSTSGIRMPASAAASMLIIIAAAITKPSPG